MRLKIVFLLGSIYFDRRYSFPAEFLIESQAVVLVKESRGNRLHRLPHRGISTWSNFSTLLILYGTLTHAQGKA